MSGVNRRREAPPTAKKPKGSTVPELDFKRIEYSKDEIRAARLASPPDLHDKLGLTEEHEPEAKRSWYYWKKEKDHG